MPPAEHDVENVAEDEVEEVPQAAQAIVPVLYGETLRGAIRKENPLTQRGITEQGGRHLYENRANLPGRGQSCKDFNVLQGGF